MINKIDYVNLAGIVLSIAIACKKISTEEYDEADEYRMSLKSASGALYSVFEDMIDMAEDEGIALKLLEAANKTISNAEAELLLKNLGK
jgi:hypothetical protein